MLATDPDLIARIEAQLSPAERFSRLPLETQRELLNAMSPEELRTLTTSWRHWIARPTQLAPGLDCQCGCKGDWLNWLILAGRGWGKTRTGAEWVHETVNTHRILHLVGATSLDARKIMIEGESGILATQKKDNPVKWSPTRFRLDWANGAYALVLSADEPERFRGIQAWAAWADELASWRYRETWTQLQLGMRLGPFPRTVITTTPRPTPLIKRLIRDERNHITKGTTYDNLSNLAEAFINEITTEYEGTRFGRQEIYAEILAEADGALWDRDTLENTRVDPADSPSGGEKAPERFTRIVVAIDPAISTSDEADETGIIVIGKGHNGHAYVLHDASGRLKPEQWARRAVALYEEYGAQSIIAEKNQGGDMVRHTIEVYDPLARVKLVNASKSKVTRAEPVATAYEKGRVHHVGYFPELEDQMCSWEAGDPESPDRLDALVWGLTELIIGDVPVVVSGGLVGNELGAAASGWSIGAPSWMGGGRTGSSWD